MGCNCKKRRQQLVQQPPTVIHLPSGQITPVEKPISEEEQKIINQINEELLKLHQQNQ